MRDLEVAVIAVSGLLEFDELLAKFNNDPVAR